MKQMDKNASTALFQLGIEKKLVGLFQDFTVEQLEEYIKRVYSPDFGKQGVYSYFCKGCSRNWNFTTKDEKASFEKFHRATGCNFEYAPAKDGETVEIDGKDVPVMVVSKDPVSPTATTVFNKLAQYKAKTEEINNQIVDLASEPSSPDVIIPEVVDYRGPKLTEVIEEAQLIE